MVQKEEKKETECTHVTHNKLADQTPTIIQYNI